MIAATVMHPGILEAMDRAGFVRQAWVRGPRPKSVGGRLLRRHGITLTGLAVYLGRPKPTVRKWLAGIHPAGPELHPALVGLVGRDEAQLIMDTIPEPAARQLGPSLAARLLHEAGLTQQSMAGPLGVNTSTVSCWCSGRSPAPQALAELLRYKLGASRAQPIIEAVPRWQP